MVEAQTQNSELVISSSTASEQQDAQSQQPSHLSISNSSEPRESGQQNQANNEEQKSVSLNSSENTAASSKKEEDLNMVMDFSTAFKNDTRRGKGKKGKKKVVKQEGEDEPDALDDINRDLEEENILENDIDLVIGEIPRNLTITQQ